MSSSILGKRPADSNNSSDESAPKEAKVAQSEPAFSDYKWRYELRVDNYSWPVWNGFVCFQGMSVERPSFLRCVFRNLPSDHAYKACNITLPLYQSMNDTLAACEDLLGNKKAKYAHQARVCLHEFRSSPEYAALRDAVVHAPLKYVADRKAAAERKQAYETARVAYVTARDLLRQLAQQPVLHDAQQFLTEDERRLCVCQVRGHFDKCPCRYML